MATLTEALTLAVQQHQAGNLARAEQIYRQILAANPTEPNALHLLGMLAHQTGQHQAAVELISQAVAILPQVGELHANLAGVYLALGQFDNALASSAEALRLRPDLPELHLQRADLLTWLGQLEEAAASYRRALALRPEHAETHHNLGNLFRQQGKFGEAEASYRETLRLQPANADVFNHLGVVLADQGKFTESEACYREAARINPGLADAHYNLGVTLASQGKHDAACIALENAIRIKPDYTEALNNLGNALRELGRLPEAAARYRQTLALRPDLVQAHYNLGLTLADQGNVDEALASYEQAVRLQPDHADALTNLGNLYKDQGWIDKAIICYRRVLAVKLEPRLHSNLLLALLYHPDYTPETIFEEQRRYAAHFESTPALPEVDRDPVRRLRIGYVSGDFREHVQGRYSENILRAHDRRQFEIFCYANVPQPDAQTERLKTLADHWCSIADLSDTAAADRIRADRIDVLIDIAGHTGGNRLGVFARKPAPVQVTHAGYPGTTGLPAVDYRLTDAYYDPPGLTERFHTETLVRLPEQQYCYLPTAAPEPGAPPLLETGQITFGSFNLLAKVSKPLLGWWAEILQRLPGSRLIVKTGVGRDGDDRVRAVFARRAIDLERVILIGRQPDYFQAFCGVDICLDTYPYSGCNVTADALWMGVPVVSLGGPLSASRQGAAMLAHAGLTDLLVETPEDYIAAAVRLAGDVARLQQLRTELRERVRQTLGDIGRFTRNLEAAYRDLWVRFCRDGLDA
jgi:predicted O-linked N-acetylglucosamine transferase (SPINDLY family)